MNKAGILDRNNINIIGIGDKTLLLAHGFGCDQTMWRFMLPELQSHFKVILFDYVGCGGFDLSAFSKTRYSTLEGYAKDIEDMETFWSLFICVKRNELFEELIQARERLEEQNKTLLELATIDPLTGLLDRRELNNQAHRMLLQTERLNLELAMLVIDVDHFKRVNDVFGHATGDKVLKHGRNEYYDKYWCRFD